MSDELNAAPSDAPANDAVADLIGSATAEQETGSVNTNAAEAAIDAALGDAPAPVNDAPPAMAPESSPAAQPAPRKGGWPKGKPRTTEARYSGQRPAATGPIEGKATATRTTKEELARENEELRRRLDTMEARERSRSTATDTEAIARLSGVIAATAKMGFDMLAMYRGDHWKIADPEAKAVGDASAVALAPYADVMGEYLPWVAMLATIYGVVAPRLERDALIAQHGALPFSVANADRIAADRAERTDRA